MALRLVPPRPTPPSPPARLRARPPPGALPLLRLRRRGLRRHQPLFGPLHHVPHPPPPPARGLRAGGAAPGRRPFPAPAAGLCGGRVPRGRRRATQRARGVRRRRGGGVARGRAVPLGAPDAASRGRAAVGAVAHVDGGADAPRRRAPAAAARGHEGQVEDQGGRRRGHAGGRGEDQGEVEDGGGGQGQGLRHARAQHAPLPRDTREKNRRVGYMEVRDFCFSIQGSRL
uniref:CFM3 n=1 Tax=Arundo donax TaxID=35708 RepID=A0A0A9HYS8_ARUDO